MRAILILKIAIFLFCTKSFAQNYFYEKHFGSENQDNARSIKLDSDSNIYIVGFTNDNINLDFNIAISKLNYAGTLLWTKQLGDPTYYNAALFINNTNDGNFIICGETEPNINNKDGFISKIDTAGNIIWYKQFILAQNQYLKFCEQTSNGDIIACGAANDSSGFYDNWVVKLNIFGDLIWMKNYGTIANEYADQIRETPEGNYILTADVRNINTNNSYDIELFKLDTAGNIIWDKIFGDDLQNGCQGILITSDNNYLSYGESEVTVNSPFDFWIDLVNPAGDTLWHKLIGGQYADAAFSAVEVNDGFIFTGYSSSYNNNAPLDLIIFKTDKNGNLIWTRTYGSSGVDIGYEIINGLNNDLFVTGKYGDNSNDYYLLHLNNDGWANITEKDMTNTSLVFPNPSAGIFYFKSDIESASVYNNTGQIVYSLNNISANSINLSHLNNGLYNLKIAYRNQSVANYLISLMK